MSTTPSDAWCLNYVIVSKYPTPGSSKTRLIPSFGKVLAAQLAMAMLRDLLARFAREVRVRPSFVLYLLCDCVFSF